MLIKIFITFILLFVLGLTPLLFENEWLKYNSYYFFTFQFFIFVIALLTRIKYLASIFLPTNLMILYLGISFSVGSYFVPLEYGFLTKSFISDFYNMKNYPIVVTVWLQFFNVMMLLSLIYLSNEERYISTINFSTKMKKPELILPISILLLLLVSPFDYFFIFGCQIALLLIILMSASRFSLKINVLSVLLSLSIFIQYNSFNKREILMALILVLLFYSITKKIKLKLNLKSLVSYSILLMSFFCIVLTSSILRGYGGIDTSNALEAFSLIPSYMTSELFYHYLMDNFEISHTFPAGVLPIEYIIESRLDVQGGATLIKPLFLILPREIFPFKPESLIHLFTATQNPAVYALGGSYPVPFPSEVFANFHYAFVPFLFLLLLAINNIFKICLSKNIDNLKFKVSIVFSAMVFILIRGGGADLLFIHFLSALPILFIYSKFKK